jgi:hypothetical protein
MAVLLTPVGLGIAPMSIVAMAQQSPLPPCDLKSVRWDNCQGSRPATDIAGPATVGVYVGEFRDNEASGRGIFTSTDGGMKYIGEFKHNTPNGQGTLDSDGVKIAGEFRNGMPDGLETITVSDGTQYIGEFRNGGLTEGKAIYPNGSIYIGELKDLQANGRGTLTYFDGGQYIGEFRNNKREGQGHSYVFHRRQIRW